MKLRPVFIAILIIAGVMPFYAQARRSSQAESLVYSCRVDMIRLKVPKWGVPEPSKSPNQYYTDLWGVQLLNDRLKPKDVVHDLVPKYARVLSAKGDQVLRLQFNDGWKADFYFDATFTLDQLAPVPTQLAIVPNITFVVVQNADSVENERPFVNKFWDVLKQANLLDKFLKKNQFFKEEQIANDAIQNKDIGSDVKELGGFDLFIKEKNAIYLVPDAVHGDESQYKVVVDLLKAPEVNWIALEMLPIDRQQALQTFLKAKANTKAFSVAEAGLFDLYRVSWRNRFGYVERPEDNHYFRLLKMAREMGKGAYAMDPGDEYIMFRYGEFPLGLASRNLVWTEQIPKDGRGLAFGGSGHMNLGRKGTVQYFIKKFNPNFRIYHYYVDHDPNKKQ